VRGWDRGGGVGGTRGGGVCSVRKKEGGGGEGVAVRGLGEVPALALMCKEGTRGGGEKKEGEERESQG